MSGSFLERASEIRHSSLQKLYFPTFIPLATPPPLPNRWPHRELAAAWNSQRDRVLPYRGLPAAVGGRGEHRAPGGEIPLGTASSPIGLQQKLFVQNNLYGLHRRSLRGCRVNNQGRKRHRDTNARGADHRAA